MITSSLHNALYNEINQIYLMIIIIILSLRTFESDEIKFAVIDQ